MANQITGEKRIFVNRRPKKNQRGEAIVLEYTPFLKVQSYTFDADFLKNKERVLHGFKTIKFEFPLKS